MLPAQRNKIDISSLSEEEQKMFRLYGKLPARANVRPNKSHERKYFDSGDYALSKAGKAPQQSVGTAIPNPERVPHASTVVGASVAATVGGIASPSVTAAALSSPIAVASSGFPATTAAPLPILSPTSTMPPALASHSDAASTTATPLPIGSGAGMATHALASSSSSPPSASSANSAGLTLPPPPPSAAQTSTSPSGLGSRNQPLGSFPVAPAHAHNAASVGETSSPLGFGSVTAAATGPLGSPATSPGASLGPGVAPRFLHRGSLSGSPGKEASSGLARAQPLSADDMMEE